MITLFGSTLYEMDTSGEVVRTCETPFMPGPFALGGMTLVGSTIYIAEAVGGDPFSGTHVFALERAALVCNPPLVLQVLIDVKPSSAANNINVGNEGLIPVAILSTGAFDAADVDPATVRFGATGAESGAAHSSLEDVDADGDLDPLVHFRTSTTGIGCATTVAVLTGTTTGGLLISRSDAVQPVGCK